MALKYRQLSDFNRRKLRTCGGCHNAEAYHARTSKDGKATNVFKLSSYRVARVLEVEVGLGEEVGIV